MQLGSVGSVVVHSRLIFFQEIYNSVKSVSFCEAATDLDGGLKVS